MHAHMSSALVSPSTSVLSVSPDPEEHQALRRILPPANWKIAAVRSIAEAREYLSAFPVSIVLCARNLPDGDWKDLLRQVHQTDCPPEVVVFARHADDWLWADVLELGGYDVIESPFDGQELYRVASLAGARARDLARLHRATGIGADVVLQSAAR